MRRPILIINCAAVIVLTVILGLSGCGKRDLPAGGGIIKVYNAEMKETTKFSPLETLYVGINGLSANKLYKVEVLDPDGETISELSVETDDKGSIAATPLWYDVGLRKADDTHPAPWIDKTVGLELKAFYVKVSSSDGKTDYKQAFYLFFKPSDVSEMVKTIAYASDSSGTLSNTFEEAGSQQYNALSQTVSASDKTRVYVTLDNLDASVTDVDVYLVPYDGTKLYANGDVLPPVANRVASLNVGSQFTTVPGTTAKVSTAPVWDINTTPPPGSATLLANPTALNTAYTVIVVPNPAGRTSLKLSGLVSGAHKSTDAIDGNSIPGFIVLNTPANDVKYSISDNLGNKTAALTAALPANTIDAGRILRLSVDNVPAAPGSVATIYVIDAGAEPANGAALTDVRGGATTALINPPSAGDLRLLPYISNANLLTTSAAFPAAYRYLYAVAADTQFDVIVKFNGAATYTRGSDLYISKGATVKPFVANTTLATYSATATTAAATYFDETGTLGGRTKVYVRYTTTGTPPAAVNTYLYKGTNSWTSGLTPLTSPLLTRTLNFSSAVNNNTAQFWDLDLDYKVINPVSDPNAANFHAYDIIVDLNNNGLYDSGEKLTVVINDTSSNTFPRVTYTNIASSGIFTYNSSGTNFGYDDLFNKYGTGTNWASHSIYTGYGIKAIWNPYLMNYNGNRKIPNLSKYEGQSVDVYIVDATTFNLKNWQTKQLTNADDVTGYCKRIPIQSGCSNGYYQNNIWTASTSAPMKTGKYYVIVDINRDGRITEGVDLIDAVKDNEKSILDDPSFVGFSVN